MNKETHNSYFNFKKIIYLYLIKNDHYYPLNTICKNPPQKMFIPYIFFRRKKV